MAHRTILKQQELKSKANWVRKQTLEMCVMAHSGHIASSFSCTDILVALYYGGILQFDPANPHWEKRDRFIMSKGHGGVALYPILADLGFFPKDELRNFCQPGGVLGAHPERSIPGIETVTGSLGHGLGIAAGLALSAKLDGREFMTVVMLGDGECYEGSVWEAAMFAGSHALNNLVAVIDRNGLCVTDFTENFLQLEPFEEKWRSFGWDVTNIDGHSFREVLATFKGFRSRTSTKPLMIIARTVKGKGVSFMEGQANWHTQIPASEQLEKARMELNRKAGLAGRC
jgi:transketolase